MEEGISKTAFALDKEAVLSLLAGFVLAAGACCFEWTRFILSYLAVLVHETGHSFFALIFGYVSIPAFNFRYGGGIALTDLDDRRVWLIALVVLFFLWLLWRWRRSLPALLLLGLVAGAYGALCASRLHHFALTTFMGHGAELLMAGVFLYRALSGRSVEAPLERPLYAFAGFFLNINAALFAFALLSDKIERIMYEEGMLSGGMANDFSILATDIFRVDLAVPVYVFLACCALPLPCAYLLHRFRGRLFKDD